MSGSSPAAVPVVVAPRRESSCQYSMLGTTHTANRALFGHVNFGLAVIGTKGARSWYRMGGCLLVPDGDACEIGYHLKMRLLAALCALAVLRPIPAVASDPDFLQSALKTEVGHYDIGLIGQQK